jgi:hypothetical protein
MDLYLDVMTRCTFYAARKAFGNKDKKYRCTVRTLLKRSVSDPGFLFRIPDLGSRIQQQQKKRGENLLYLFFVATNFILDL